MKSLMTKYCRAISKFHRDEAGLEALQVVMIVAIAAIMLLFVKLYWEKIVSWFKVLVDKVLGWGEAT